MRPVSLLALSLLTLLDSIFPGTSLWAREVHPIKFRSCLRQALIIIIVIIVINSPNNIIIVIIIIIIHNDNNNNNNSDYYSGYACVRPSEIRNVSRETNHQIWKDITKSKHTRYVYIYICIYIYIYVYTNVSYIVRILTESKLWFISSEFWLFWSIG